MGMKTTTTKGFSMCTRDTTNYFKTGLNLCPTAQKKSKTSSWFFLGNFSCFVEFFFEKIQ